MESIFFSVAINLISVHSNQALTCSLSTQVKSFRLRNRVHVWSTRRGQRTMNNVAQNACILPLQDDLVVIQHMWSILYIYNMNYKPFWKPNFRQERHMFVAVSTLTWCFHPNMAWEFSHRKGLWSFLKTFLANGGWNFVTPGPRWKGRANYWRGMEKLRYALKLIAWFEGLNNISQSHIQVSGRSGQIITTISRRLVTPNDGEK